MEAHGEMRNELVRGSYLADEKSHFLKRDSQSLYIHGLIIAPRQEPASRRREYLWPRAIQRDLAAIAEYSHPELAMPEDRRGGLPL